MNPDLMCSSCDRLDVKKGKTLEFLSDSVTGFGGSGFFCLDRHPGSVLGVTADRPSEVALLDRHFSPDKS